jgi:predicted membrane protein
MTAHSTIPAPPGRRSDQPGRGVPDLGRLLVGLSVVGLGVLFMLDAAGVLDAGRAIDRWWPAVIVAAGLLTLTAERPPSVYRGLVLTAIGAVLLLFTTDTIGESAWSYVWSAAVVLAGLTILSRWRGRAAGAPIRDDAGEVVRATAIFSGPHVASTAARFRGAWLTAVFGGVTLDLRGAGLDPGGAAVNATVVFGGAEILVPKGWRISVRSTPIFGGVEDKTDKSVQLDDAAPTLRVDAVALFGGVDIKHDEE